MVGDSKRQPKHQSGDDPGQEQSGHRHAVVGDRENDHQDGRRNDRPDRCRCRRQGTGIVGLVSGLAHHPHDDGRWPGSVRERGPGDACKKHGNQNVHVPEAAADMPDQIVGEAQQGGCQSAGCHQLRGQDEKGNRHQREGIDPAEHALRDQKRG